MIVYYFNVECAIHERSYLHKQIAVFRGNVADFPADRSPLGRAFILDDSITPPRIIRNNFGPWITRIEWNDWRDGTRKISYKTNLEQGIDDFWWFFRREGHSLPEYYTNTNGDIMGPDCVCIMPGPEPEKLSTSAK